MKLLVLFSLLCGAQASLKFNNYFGNGMVLQREAENKIWGYGMLESNDVIVSCILRNEQKTHQSYKATQVDDENWEVTVQGNTAHSRCTIEFVGHEELKLENILMGDVWICSGQSNMEQNMNNIDNAQEEIANSAKYGDIIRYTIVKNQYLFEHDDNFDLEMDLPWSYAADAEKLQYMSAICFLYARTLYDVLDVPMGLVDSDWGGTPIEAWSPKAPLDSCNIPDHVDENAPAWSNSALWHGMINPLKRTSVKGFLWYQGEANAFPYNREEYSCTFPAMIESWRKEFSENSGTWSQAPFGFVQLSTWRADNQENGFPVIRWHQTKDVGYVPNEYMSNVFMSSPLDTFDPADDYPGGIHPRYKQIAAERLAIAGLNVTYNLNYPSGGPFPINMELNGKELEITYDQDLELKEAEISGFYFCADVPDMCDKGSTVEMWTQIDGPAVQTSPRTLSLDLSGFSDEDLSGGSLAYLWRETPVQKLLGLPIYSADEFQLPSPPWKFKL